jgi:hypothetical protein
MYELPSLNCGHCLIDTKCFGIDIAHFVVVVKRVQACFGAERALVRDLGYSPVNFMFSQPTPYQTVR